MSKTDEYRTTLEPLVAEAAKTGDRSALEDFLTAHSNLPGPRGNLELAEAYARTATELAATEPDAA